MESPELQRRTLKEMNGDNVGGVKLKSILTKDKNGLSENRNDERQTRIKTSNAKNISKVSKLVWIRTN